MLKVINKGKHPNIATFEYTPPNAPNRARPTLHLNHAQSSLLSSLSKHHSGGRSHHQITSIRGVRGTPRVCSGARDHPAHHRKLLPNPICFTTSSDATRKTPPPTVVVLAAVIAPGQMPCQPLVVRQQRQAKTPPPKLVMHQLSCLLSDCSADTKHHNQTVDPS